MSHWTRRRAPARAGAVLLGAALASTGCSSHELAPPPPHGPPPRVPGTYLARELEQRGWTAQEHAAAFAAAKRKPAAPAFVSPYGHELRAAPIVHPERSVGGRELRYWVVGAGAEVVLVLGGIHGDEASSVEAAFDLLARLEETPAAAGTRKVVVAPDVNPDGRLAKSRRNLRGVDLNRNFPAHNWREEPAHGPGERPGSEPESRFVQALVRIYSPAIVIATHAAAACVNWDGPAEALAERMSAECGLPAVASIGYPTPGSLGSWLGIDDGVPTITLELATKERVGDARDGVLRALLAAIAWNAPAPAEVSAAGPAAPPTSGALRPRS